eukprot:jgi/Chlat1/1662/Chrsp127S01903
MLAAARTSLQRLAGTRLSAAAALSSRLAASSQASGSSVCAGPALRSSFSTESTPSDDGSKQKEPADDLGARLANSLTWGSEKKGSRWTDFQSSRSNQQRDGAGGAYARVADDDGEAGENSDEGGERRAYRRGVGSQYRDRGFEGRASYRGGDDDVDAEDYDPDDFDPAVTARRQQEDSQLYKPVDLMDSPMSDLRMVPDRVWFPTQQYEPEDLNITTPRPYFDRLSTKRKIQLQQDMRMAQSYKNVRLLRSFLTEGGRISPRRRTGLKAKEQRAVNRNIKTARMMGLMPFTSRFPTWYRASPREREEE